MENGWTETIRELEEKNAQLRQERDNWKDTAEQFLRNQVYYAGLLDKIAESLGPEVFISDDGSVQDTVLRAKIPQLVEELRQQVEECKKYKAFWDQARLADKMTFLAAQFIILAMDE
uniref:Uncharacterized protein n=1 Tax=viral metagenome TaxID=1070528 RepID=A0A6M3LNS0_9ZZZZ